MGGDARGKHGDEIVKDRLEAQYGDEGNFNVREGNGQECAVFPDGTAWAFCTNWAHYVRRIEGDRAEIYGFFGEDNPTAGVNDTADGHDFALVDGRYLVDGWVRHVECLADRTVFDLEDETDRAFVEKFYGDRSKWERGEGNEKAIDAESPERRAAAMEGVTVLEAPALRM